MNGKGEGKDTSMWIISEWKWALLLQKRATNKLVMLRNQNSEVNMHTKFQADFTKYLKDFT